MRINGYLLYSLTVVGNPWTLKELDQCSIESELVYGVITISPECRTYVLMPGVEPAVAAVELTRIKWKYRWN